MKSQERKFEQPPDRDENDRFGTMQKIVMVVVNDLKLIISCIQQVIEKSTLPLEIIRLVKVIQTFKNQLDSTGISLVV
jgi:hypothetical protein